MAPTDMASTADLAHTGPVILATDVDYPEGAPALAAGVVFEAWTDPAPAREYLVSVPDPAPYVPGQFYRRELPCLQDLLAEVAEDIDTVVIDGYVDLDTRGRMGLGAHLHEALDRELTVIGVAKNAFGGNDAALEVLRGESIKPLFVTARGIDPADAAAAVARMHGRFRLPTLLKRVDRLCRDGRR
ncbi:Deoxyinosine 3'endonuclease (endonuclease V) [Plesiocystis pacifica SIR-1]|uniref:Deoxyinosine 3'endonuclease (Endonuclease V) n=1 Tax=Plesiocystis pacifica SIR-1 TaxID=391625 RepID=A6G650_9BACT|nr:Deoxyinosine 3'endonuclease (endonuclease V) [Plesiocystis pacifica SIR-1]